jgi:hypothetical protein
MSILVVALAHSYKAMAAPPTFGRQVAWYSKWPLERCVCSQLISIKYRIAALAQVQLYANCVCRRQRDTAARAEHRGADGTDRSGHVTVLQSPSTRTGRKRSIASKRGRIDRNAIRTITRCDKLMARYTALIFNTHSIPTFT